MRKEILFSLARSFRLKILLIVFSGLCASSSFSQPNTWLGGPNPQDTLASNPAFWSAGLPTATSDIIIPNGAKPLFVDVSTTYASVTFQGGNLLTRVGIGPVVVTITGNITIENAAAPRGIIILGALNCGASITGGTNTDPLGVGNAILVVDPGDITVSGDISGCNMALIGSNPEATMGGNFTGGTLLVDPSGLARVIFNSTDPQTVPAGTYVRIQFSGGGTKTLDGPITISEEANFNSGIVINSSSSLIFVDGSLGGGFVFGGPTSFATGPIRVLKSLPGAISIPVGKQGAGYHPVNITSLSSNQDFTVEYIQSSARALGPITAPGILAVSDCEYWNISQTTTGNANVELTWGPPNSGCGITDPPSLRMVHFNGTSWDAAGSDAGTGTASVGSVSWTGLSVFSPFTIGTTSLANPLPVKFGVIKAYEKQNGIQLDWKVYSENKVKNYEVERSADARSFTSVGSLAALYNNTAEGDYGFFDANPLAGTSYYRIKNNDLDGRSSYSIVIRVNRNKSIKGLSLYPNPVVNGNILLQGSDLGRGSYKINIFGANGQEIYKQQIKHNGGTISQTIQLPSTISKGVYMLSVKDENGNIIFNEKLVKQ